MNIFLFLGIKSITFYFQSLAIDESYRVRKYLTDISADCRRRNGFYLAISPRSATIQKQKNRLDKVSLISKKILMRVNAYLPNLDVEAPV
jgi:hypothetical protein